MGELRKFEPGKKKEQTMLPTINYTDMFYSMADLFAEVSNNLLDEMKRAAKMAGLSFQKFVNIPMMSFSSENQEVCLKYGWKSANGSEYYIEGFSEIYDELYDLNVTVFRIRPHKSEDYFDFEESRWIQRVDLKNQEEVKKFILQDRTSAKMITDMEALDYFSSKAEVLLFCEDFKEAIELYSKVSEFMEPVYNPDENKVYFYIYDPNRCGFSVVCESHKFYLQQFLNPIGLMDLSEDVDFIESDDAPLIEDTVWCGTNIDKLVDILNKMGSKITKPYTFTFPLSGDAYMEFRKLDLSDLEVVGGLTDAEYYRLHILKKRLKKILRRTMDGQNN